MSEKKLPPSPANLIFHPPLPPDPRESIDALMKELNNLRKKEKEIKDELQEVQNEIQNVLIDLKPLVKIVNDTLNECIKDNAYQ